ncbi:MAG: L-threonylcarbamoyladenylate synthase [Chitinispirillaceae bacterium]|nr:L-threonylcarbamoyladenylate synthase [Chitinispirillaceae bacterium]
MVVYNIHPVNPQYRLLEAAARICKEEGGVAIYPTDTFYGIGACVVNVKAIEKISRILRRDMSKPYSFICNSFSQMSRYVQLSNANFRIMKRYLPGPFTFILPATHPVTKKICPKRKTVGVRIPDCRVVLDFVSLLGEPLANITIELPEDIPAEPHSIRNFLKNDADVMLDAGVIEHSDQSTVVDLTGDEPVVIREGKGEWHG